ncbi:MAG TPA: folylpolyglutamate synthase/dihydrofolate synthase family protein [Dongiaceae bacterium]|nr:folylpolyglutamate synthase/dihydrofolate synthase family protein [Dongiaceae bacterium]
MTYPDAIRFLYDLRWFGAKFGLGNTFKLAELAGNPQRHLRFIHVAGTNGKGSTCAMLESVYRAAGLRVGLFTSPHLVAFGERIQVNRRPIGQAEVARLAAELRDWVEQFPAAEHPTFFEVVTVMALRYFAARECDLVVWETGLGGRLDATNIVTPLASVITNIQFDHQEWLGETLADIAAEKAGIIKPGVPVISGAEAPEARAVIAAKARQQNAPLTLVTPADAQRPPLDGLHLPLLGRHQKANAAVAVAAVRALAPQLPVNDSALCAGLSRVRWAGRLQLAILPSGQKLLLDGAHNVGGAQMLASALEEYFPSAKPALVLGILRDKDWAAMCAILAPLAGRILLAPVHSERTAEPHGLAEACRRANPRVPIGEFPSLAAALADTAPEPFVTVAGSLYLIGEAMELLHLSPAKAGQERDLNEWIGGAQIKG